MKNLKLINSPHTHQERIQSRINAFQADILAGDGDINYVNDILVTVFEYLSEYDDQDLYASAIKIKEAIFYIDNYTNYWYIDNSCFNSLLAIDWLQNILIASRVLTTHPICIYYLDIISGVLFALISGTKEVTCQSLKKRIKPSLI